MDKTKQCAHFRRILPLTLTKPQADIKHDKLNVNGNEMDRVEMLPPSHRPDIIVMVDWELNINYLSILPLRDRV